MRAYVKPGDWVLLFAAGALATTLMIHSWLTPAGDRAVVRSGGKLFTELDLAKNGVIAISGPLGITRLEIARHRIRVASDPGPRQICVKEGWLSRAGQAALCLPNQVSVEIVGLRRAYDSLNY